MKIFYRDLNKYSKNLKYFIITLIIFFFSPETSWGFSLGSIDIKSSFNKGFYAEIPVALDDDKGLTAGVGTSEDYERLGIFRHNFADKITTSVEPQNAKNALIKLQSPDPLILPSFNLVIKCVHNGGTILENFIITLDFQKNLSLNVTDLESDPKPEKNEQKKSQMIVAETAGTKETRQIISKKIEEKQIEPEKELTSMKLVEKKQAVNSDLKENIEAMRVPKRHMQLKPSIINKNKDVGDTIKYKVSRGDSLFKIAKKIGATGDLVEPYVVEIWRRNSNKFRNNNMNLLLQDSVLDLQGIKEGAMKITKAEAIRVIQEQMNRLKKGTAYQPKVVTGIPGFGGVEMPLPSEANLWDDEQVIKLVKEWEVKWEEGEIDLLMSLYSKKFRAGIYNFNSWREFKSVFGTKHGKFDIHIEKIKISFEQNLASVAFIQTFKSKIMETRGTKILYLNKEGEDYKIINEVWQKEFSKEGKHPYVIHVASFRSHDLALKEVNLLRKKGYSAYEVLFDVAGKGSFFRVVIDRFVTESEAKEFTGNIKKKNLVDYVNPVEMPYAVEAGKYRSRDEAYKNITKIRSAGYSPYPLLVCNMDECYYHVLIGAYQTKENALPLADKLTKSGITNEIVTP